jgi:NADPH:quinone reductase-like Zn-dependent oxidoreductase
MSISAGLLELLSDLLMMAGSYGYRPRLPAIMGTEGAGRIIAVGAGVKHVKEHDRTLVPFPHSAWGRAHQDRRTLAAAIVAGRHQPVRHDGRQASRRLLSS